VQAANAPKSGVYDDLILARNPSNSDVTGYYRSETGGGQFTCKFYFKGKLKSGAAEIESYLPGEPMQKISGLLVVESEKSVTVKHKDEHGGCWNVQHFADTEQPATFSASKIQTSWLEIRVVRAAKSNFYKSPKGKTPLKSYLVEGNAVGVVDNQPDWVKVDDPGEKKTTSGWIKRGDLI
jgi:hypothetical protein